MVEVFEPKAVLAVRHRLQAFAEGLLASRAVARGVKDVVEHDAVESALRQGDRTHPLEIVLPLAAVEARHPPEIHVAVQRVPARLGDSRP